MLARANHAAKRLTAAFALISCVIAVEIPAAGSPPRVDILSSELQQIYQHPPAYTTAPTINSAARFDASGRVQVDVHYDCATSAPVKQLLAAGFKFGSSIKVPPMCIVEGWVAAKSLSDVGAIPGVQRVDLPSYALRRSPSPLPRTSAQRKLIAPRATSGTGIDGNAVSIMNADTYVSQTSVNGSGVTVGVISDDITSLSTIQQRGELPAVNVVLPSANPTPHPAQTDEGTMMLEEVHAVAPGASLAFCGPETPPEYVACLQQLASAGSTIIVDDVAYPTYDVMTAASGLTQSVENFLSQNAAISLFTVTENYNGSYWEGAYTPVPLSSFGLAPLTCAANGQVDLYVESFDGTGVESMQVFANQTLPIWMQWADAYGQNVSNFDVYIINSITNTLNCVPSAGSSNTYLYGTDAFLAGTYHYIIATPDPSLQGKFLKIFAGGNGDTIFSVPTAGSIVSPQAFATGVLTIGAVNGSDSIGNTPEPYSGRGPITFALPTPSSISAPSAVAPDAVNVDAAGTAFQSELWSDGFFHGTSAAAPNAAAVAALIRSAFPNLSPVQVTTALQTGATQLGGSVPDSTFGYGRVDAIGALGAIPGPGVSGFGITSVTGGSSSAAALTLTGTGKLGISIGSSNRTLISSSSVKISPSGCGTTTLACVISITPANGQIGSAIVSVTVSDGANRSATLFSTIAVSKPAPPTITITSGGTQSVSQGSAAAITFTLTGTGPLSVAGSSSNTSAIPASGVMISSGCGASVLACTANLSSAGGQGGSSTVTFTVKDSYGQMASANAAVQVTKAAATSHSSGGGAIDFDTLLVLATILGWRMLSWTQSNSRHREASIH